MNNNNLLAEEEEEQPNSNNNSDVVIQELWCIFTYYTLSSDPLYPDQMKSSAFVRCCARCDIISRKYLCIYFYFYFGVILYLRFINYIFNLGLYINIYKYIYI